MFTSRLQRVEGFLRCSPGSAGTLTCSSAQVDRICHTLLIITKPKLNNFKNLFGLSKSLFSLVK